MRHKSEATIQLERDRAIRKERTELKRQEREAKRQARLKKRLTHESVVWNGVPKVKPEESRFGLREAIAYSPFVLCGGCGVIVREDVLIDGFCLGCKYREEVVDSPECLKAKQGDTLTGAAGPLEAQDERRRA